MPEVTGKTKTDEAIELENRVKQFNAEFMPLLGKYKLGIGAVAFLLPDGRIAAKPQLLDDSKSKEEPKVSGNGKPPEDDTSGLATA